MKPTFTLRLLVTKWSLGLLVLHASAGFAPAQPVIDEGVHPVSGVLLLKNGGVVRGETSRSGDRWLVKNAGREIQLPAGNVDIVARTLAELYDAQRLRLTRPTAEAHLGLAEWCLRNELLPQASRELSAARALDPRNPRLALLEQRLAIATAPRAARPVVQPEAAQSPRASVSAPATINEDAHAVITPPNLSDAVIERFTRRVQPILINNCTTAGCHQPGGTQAFQLDRALLHGLSNRRSTMSNLTATLALVDRERPQQSPLLTVPRVAHGGMEQPVFGPAHKKLVEQLIEWVTLVADKAAVEPTVATDTTTQPGSRATENLQPASFDEATLAQPTAGPRYGAQLQPWRPKDPFDPEIFNRRFHGAHGERQ